MNEAYIIGKITTEIKFDFILNSKDVSICRFRVITVFDKQEINVIAYNKMADYIYANMKIDNTILIRGHLANNRVILEEIYRMN